MKIVINADFGGFGYGVNPEFEDFINENCNDRANPDLVAFVEEHLEECGDLDIVEIPDEATDWEISDYDGCEEVIYVLNGKIYHY